MATNNAINTDTNSFCKTANNLSDVATPAAARLNLFVPLSVTTTTVLTADDYGKEVVCTGSSSYALTLPTVTSNANKFIDIFSQTTSNALITITPASGTIAGQSTLIIGTGDGVRIMNDGTNWFVLNCWLQPASFYATLSADQTVANSTATRVNYNGVSFDIGSFFDTVTNHRYNPKLPGKYTFTNHIGFKPSAATNLTVQNGVQKNGTGIVTAYNILSTANLQYSFPATVITGMNGTTDYVEGIGFQNSGGNLDIFATASFITTFMVGSRLSLF